MNGSPAMDTLDELADGGDQFYSIMRRHLQEAGDQLMAQARSRVWLVDLFDRAQAIASRPATCAAVIFLLASLLIVHTSDYWLHAFAKRLPFRLISRRVIGGADRQPPSKLCYEFRSPDAGIYAMQGRRPKMEDTVAAPRLQPQVAGSPLRCFRPPQEADAGANGSPLAAGLGGSRAPQPGIQGDDTGIEMYAIFDGHGGDTASLFAQESLLDAVAKELRRLLRRPEPAAALGSAEKDARSCSATSLDQLVSSFDYCSLVDNNNAPSRGQPPTAELVSRVIQEQTLRVDASLCRRLKERADIAGTTALIAAHLPHSNQLLVANVGDSRGVLCNHQYNAVPLSFDHKPNHPKELNRINEAGGFIKFNGVWRVAGILATSRALGDYPLKDKNFLTAQPEVLTFDLTELRPRFVVLASDGLWDILSNEAVVKFVRSQLALPRPKRLFQRRGELAVELARRLALYAYSKGSLDNITVLVWLFDYQSPVDPEPKPKDSPMRPVRVQKVIREEDLVGPAFDSGCKSPVTSPALARLFSVSSQFAGRSNDRLEVDGGKTSPAGSCFLSAGECQSN